MEDCLLFEWHLPETGRKFCKDMRWAKQAWLRKAALKNALCRSCKFSSALPLWGSVPVSSHDCAVCFPQTTTYFGGFSFVDLFLLLRNILLIRSSIRLSRLLHLQPIIHFKQRKGSELGGGMGMEVMRPGLLSTQFVTQPRTISSFEVEGQQTIAQV